MVNYSKNENGSFNCIITIKHELEPVNVFNASFSRILIWVKDMIDYHNLPNLEDTFKKFVLYHAHNAYKQTLENANATSTIVCVEDVEFNYHLALKNAFLEIEKRTDDEGVKSRLWVIIPQLYLPPTS